MMKQCVEQLEKERLKLLAGDFAKELYTLFYFTLDFFTKKEIRIVMFNILLRLIDAFLVEKTPLEKNLNEKLTDKIFDNLKNNYDSKQNIEKEKELKLPTELHEFFLISVEFNLYNQKYYQGLNITSFQENSKLFLEEEKLLEIKNGEWLKLIRENNPVLGVEELILKVISKKFLIFFKKNSFIYFLNINNLKILIGILYFHKR